MRRRVLLHWQISGRYSLTFLSGRAILQDLEFHCIDNRTNTFLKNTIKPIDILGIQGYNTKHEMKGDMTK